MSAPRLVVFDCDGTLVDSQALVIAAINSAFEGCGLARPRAAAIRHSVGLSLDRTLRLLAPDESPTTWDRLHEAVQDAWLDQRSRPDLVEPLFAGAIEAIEALGAAGIVLGIATGKGRRGLLSTLDRHGIADRFATLQTADDAPSKPAPDMLLQAIAEVGGEPARTVMVGDTEYDMAMALAARAVPIGVGWGYHPPAALQAAGARQVLAHFDDLVDCTIRALETGRG